MRRPLRTIETEIEIRIRTRMLPRGRRDAGRQLSLVAAAYLLYLLVRGVADRGGDEAASASLNATRVIDLERALHVFVEPSIEAWTNHRHWLMTIADWAYLNVHFTITAGALVFIYLRRTEAFAAVRNAFLLAMGFALAGYVVFPTAPPRLMGQWGFTDAIARMTGIVAAHGPGSELINLYAAIPSVHVCFAVLTGAAMARLTGSRAARVAWRAYPLIVALIVVATGNHYLTDVVLGALTAAVSMGLARRVTAGRVAGRVGTTAGLIGTPRRSPVPDPRSALEQGAAPFNRLVP